LGPEDVTPKEVRTRDHPAVASCFTDYAISAANGNVELVKNNFSGISTFPYYEVKSQVLVVVLYCVVRCGPALDCVTKLLQNRRKIQKFSLQYLAFD
jgi:hypothetical protein